MSFTGDIKKEVGERVNVLPPDISLDTVPEDIKERRELLASFFLTSGSMGDPGKKYHLEFSCRSEKQALQLKALLESFEITAHMMVRKERYIVYIKEGDGIAEFLNIIGAHRQLMIFENMRIEKELRGAVNRAVNCDTANAGKIVKAAMKQIEDIQRLKENGLYASLPEDLKKTAEARLDHPEASIEELGRLMDPPLGKSGINHRLRRIKELAGEVKEDNI
ncbi:MAG: DNA-binding protein WhiA [Lachnospiraceae bacterium]|jgi:DNA-binding protein WhiA|nr:DNA-binding protein WhiA [Lachnospiraceae bacterium]MCR4937281.1 DNA-binding protein WhiA [Lachnospiraceae bacterium]